MQSTFDERLSVIQSQMQAAIEKKLSDTQSEMQAAMRSEIDKKQSEIEQIAERAQREIIKSKEAEDNAKRQLHMLIKINEKVDRRSLIQDEGGKPEDCLILKEFDSVDRNLAMYKETCSIDLIPEISRQLNIDSNTGCNNMTSIIQNYSEYYRSECIKKQAAIGYQKKYLKYKSKYINLQQKN